MIRLCIFDLDGLLIDSERCMWHVTMGIAAKEQGRILTYDLHKKYMGLNKNDTNKLILDAFGEDFDLEQFDKRTAELNKGIIESGIPLMKGARQLLDYVRSKGIKTCIGTTTKRVDAVKVIKYCGLDKDFDDMVCGDEIENGKPAPDIYNKCISKFGYDKSEALVFEDGNAGAHAAISAGIRLILVPTIVSPDEEVNEKAYKIIDNLGEAIDIIKEENERTTSV